MLREEESMKTNFEVTNFMGGLSFKLFNPLSRLKLVAFSAFLGEPSYYQPLSDEDTVSKVKNKKHVINNSKEHLLFPTDLGVSRNKCFYSATMDALEYDFRGTLELAVMCRNEFLMRKSTAQILAIAASHPDRASFNLKNPLFFRDILVKCWLLPSDAIACLDAWKALFGSKAKFPSFIKRAYEQKLRDLTPYQQEKYRRDSISMVRLCHASKPTLKNNRSLETLMNDGCLELDDKDIKWEKHRSSGKSWLQTLDAMEWRMPHMAALRNIRGFCASNPGLKKVESYLEMVLAGVKGGKQFPFRYISAYEQMEKAFNRLESEAFLKKPDPVISDSAYEEMEKAKQKRKPPAVVPVEYKPLVMNYLERCLQASIENYPMLEGDVISLSDNSGSAHGTCTSTYGSRKVSDIGNLSALFTAYRATGRGAVGVFGDDLKLYEVSKSRPLLEQYREICDLGARVGARTENGVWLFFKRAFENPSTYTFDHWFCYSDMQVGHGGLYGNDPDIKHQGFEWGNNDVSIPCLYIDIHKCVAKYRMEINPKLNTYMVQTAGYNNSILPESTYRGAVLTGWTGNEVVYAKRLSELWDDIECVTVRHK